MTQCDRRNFLAAALGAAARSPRDAQQPPAGTPAPRDWSGQTPIRYPDPDVVAVDNRFRKYVIGNTTIKRVYTGTLWAEGPAWNGVGRFLWSDIPNNVQMRWTEEDGRVTVFRNPSGYSNGNTFDFEGRQLSCEHGNRRVARYEYNGTITVIADKFGGKRLNSPNDIVVHPDGGIWFTDPTCTGRCSAGQFARRVAGREPGADEHVRRLEPRCFYDLVVEVAIVRPGRCRRHGPAVPQAPFRQEPRRIPPPTGPWPARPAGEDPGRQWASRSTRSRR